MTDFDFDVMQKKQIARGAYHKKNGSHSKGCRLPSDSLTAAQRKKMNGTVETFRLDQPLTWAEYKTLDDYMRTEYIKRCKSLYGVSGKALAEMFGISFGAVCREMKRLHVQGNRGDRMTEAQKAMWAAFCNGAVGGGDSVAQPNPAVEDKVEDKIIELAHETPAPAPRGMKEVKLTFGSVASWDELVERLRFLPRDRSAGDHGRD